MARINRPALVPLAAMLLVAACAGLPAGSPIISADPTPSITAASNEAGVAPPFVLPQPDWQVACQGIDAESCRLMANDVAVPPRPGRPALRTVLIRCTEPPCTADQGGGETVLIYADGSSESHGSWGYGSAVPAGTPPMPPHPPPGDWELVCEGLARSQCEEFAADSYEAVDAVGLEMAKLTLSCDAATCTSTAGRVRAVATFVDGSEQVVGEWGYVGSGP